MREYLQKGAGTDQYTVLANRVEQALDRRRARRQLTAERQRREGLFGRNPNPVIEGEYVDRDGSPEPVIRAVNEAFESVFGYDAADVRGEFVDDVVQPLDGTETADGPTVDDAAVSGEAVQAELRRETADGVRDFLTTLIPLSEPVGPERGYAVYTDITHRKRRERRIDGLARATDELLRADEPEAAARTIVADRFKLEAIGVYLSDGETLVPCAVTDALRTADGEAPAHHRNGDRATDAAVWAAFENGETIGGRWAAPLIEHGVVSPLADHGVLLAGTTTGGAVDETTTALLEVAAADLTAALDRIERERIARTMQDAARRIRRCRSVETACEQTVAASAGVAVDESERFAVNEGALGLSYRENRSVVVNDATNHPAAEPRGRGFHSAVSVPVGDHGVFQAVATRRKAFDDRDRERVEDLVSHLTATLDRLREETETPSDSFDGTAPFEE